LECNFSTFPPEEEALFESLKNSVVVNPDLEEFVGMDEESRAKAIKRARTIGGGKEESRGEPVEEACCTSREEVEES